MKTFDTKAYNSISKLFRKNRRNPNGARITSTLYVTGAETDACALRKLYEDGHELESNIHCRGCDA